jgi:DNA polymerase III subunit delta'
MLFSDVVGQAAAKAHLLGMWQQNHLPHALLINGKEGTGGLPMAFALAQYLFCSNKSATDSCGQCPNCQKVSKLEHADVHLSFPTIRIAEKKTEALSNNYIKEFRPFILAQPYATVFEWLQHIHAENKQGNITAEECRLIIEKLNLKSYEGGLKLMIIWRPEYLGKEGNILLKLIEEPPADTIIILVSESVESILPTILSRVQLIKLPPIQVSEIEQALLNKHNLEPKKAKQIAMMADGSYTEAITLIQHIENDLFPMARQWFNMIFTQNGIGVVKFVDELSKQGREQQRNFLQYVIHLLEATLRQRYTNISILANEELTFVQKLAAAPMSFEAIETLIEEIGKTSYYIQRNASAKIQLQALCIKMMYAIQNKKVSSLVQ